MPLSRPDVVVLTGASGGIGAALAEAYARPGATLGLVGRDVERLAAVSARCQARGAAVETALLDIRDQAALAEWLTGFDDRHPVDLLIANAGVSAGLGPRRSAEAPGVAARLADINYKGMVNTVEPLIEPMRRRRRGQIALVSSIAGLRPYPDMPSYSATKAAVRAYGTALRGWLSLSGVAVSVIVPGFVTSPMSARHRGPKPMEISAERAARIIVRGLARRRATIAFPFLIVLGLQASKLLPTRLSDMIMRSYRATVEPDDGR